MQLRCHFGNGTLQSWGDINFESIAIVWFCVSKVIICGSGNQVVEPLTIMSSDSLGTFVPAIPTHLGFVEVKVLV